MLWKKKRYMQILGITITIIILPIGLNIVNLFSIQGENDIIKNYLNLTQYVNPFIGTGSSSQFGGGHTFPGAAYPWGMVQFSPDTISNPPGGYSYIDSIIKGFSLTHFSGRGCQVYQDFPFTPYVGKIIYSPATNGSIYYSNFSHSSEIANPAYYRVHLDGSNVTAELSVTPRTGIGQFTYPPSTESTMIINTGGSINGNTNSSVTIIPSESEVIGSAESIVGCNINPYKIYFAAKFDRPFSKYGTWSDELIDYGSTSNVGQKTGAFIVFNTTIDNVIRVQVGISFISIENARLNLDIENGNFDIYSIAKEGDRAWNKILNSIHVQGGTKYELATFYTALYHVFFHPNIFNDVNGEYLGFDGKVHKVTNGRSHYENIPGWDQYRTMIVLLSILEPTVASDVVQSLVVDAGQGDGHIPRWAQANTDSHGMSGDGGSILIAQAYAYGAKVFDTESALDAMIHGQPKIREGFEDYIEMGYVPFDTGIHAASITLEYSVADFAIAQFALALGNTRDYETFLYRSGNWKNVFNTSNGYIQPRYRNGSWISNFEPTSQEGFEEGNSAQYSWMVPFDLRGLFDQMGGNSVVIDRLNNFFTFLNNGPYSPYLYIGNEPSVQIPWEYNFAQTPSRSQEVVRRIQSQLFRNEPGGLPGNDDAGSLSSWYIFSAMGIYPAIPGIGGFAIGSPIFNTMTLNLPNGEKIQINKEETEAADLGPYEERYNIYVQSLKINGENSTGLWLPWSNIMNGVKLDFILGDNPSTWGTKLEDAPPSFSPNT